MGLKLEIYQLIKLTNSEICFCNKILLKSLEEIKLFSKITEIYITSFQGIKNTLVHLGEVMNF